MFKYKWQVSNLVEWHCIVQIPKVISNLSSLYKFVICVLSLSEWVTCDCSVRFRSELLFDSLKTVGWKWTSEMIDQLVR